MCILMFKKRPLHLCRINYNLMSIYYVISAGFINYGFADNDNHDKMLERPPEIVFKRGYLSEATAPELFIKQTNAETQETTRHLAAEKVLEFYQ